MLLLAVTVVFCGAGYALASRKAIPRLELPNDQEANLTTINDARPAEAREYSGTMRFGGNPQRAASLLIDPIPTVGEHYVYVHKGPDGKIFYVGKGVGNRAYSKDRMSHWHHYVKTRCGGEYTVEIVRRFADDDAALEFESDVIALYGDNLVNWSSSGRQMDLVVLAQFHSLRKQNWVFIGQARAVEEPNPTAAEEAFTEAIRRMSAYATLVLEVGLLPQLSREMNPAWDCHLNTADINALDRLTLLHKKQDRWQDLIDSADSFFDTYPTTRSFGLAVSILKRRDVAQRKLRAQRKMTPL